MNKVNLIGRLTKDIELRATPAGHSVTRFVLAVDRRKKDEADFIACTAWGKTAEILEKYVHKGNKLGITGRIQTSTYEKDGRKVYTTDVLVEEFDFLTARKQEDKPGKQDNFNPDDYGFHAMDEGDDIPF